VERWSGILRHRIEKVWSEENWWDIMDIVDMVAKFRVPYKRGGECNQVGDFYP